MRLFLTYAVLAILLCSCSKEKEQNDISTCSRQMKEIFDEELQCTQQHFYEVNLYVGTYKSEKVYFTNIMCPTCNTIPPTYGYNCEKKKITFDNFANIKDVKEVYNSCTKKFSE